MSVPARGCLALCLLGWALACGAPPAEEAAVPITGPVGPTGYGAILAEAAGGPVRVRHLVAAAAGAAERIERHMDELAAGVGEPRGWRPLFERLRLEAPPDEAAVLEAYRRELARAAAFTRSRGLVSLPETEPEVLTLENPSLRAHFPLALYHDGRFAVTTASAAGDDPSYLTNHCRVCIPPLAVHEGYPGHHVAFARMAGDDGVIPSVAELARFKPFVEGWGLYAEVLMLEQGYYVDVERRMAAWRMVLLRLTRSEIDARLHEGALQPSAAETIYRERLLLSPAAATAEVRGHLAKPGVKASYFLGLRQILELRQAVRDVEPGVTLGEFHDRLLGAPAAVGRIARQRFGVELGSAGEAELAWPWSPDEPGVARGLPH